MYAAWNITCSMHRSTDPSCTRRVGLNIVHECIFITSNSFVLPTLVVFCRFRGSRGLVYFLMYIKRFLASFGAGKVLTIHSMDRCSLFNPSAHWSRTRGPLNWVMSTYIYIYIFDAG